MFLPKNRDCDTPFCLVISNMAGGINSKATCDAGNLCENIWFVKHTKVFTAYPSVDNTINLL